MGNDGWDFLLVAIVVVVWTMSNNYLTTIDDHRFEKKNLQSSPMIFVPPRGLI